MPVVVMAGGFGTRLRPLTEGMPKPMLPVGGKPLLERTIIQLRDAGFAHIHLTTYYLPEKIHEHFGDGSAFGVNLTYVQEEKPLGTAGAIGLLDPFDEPLLLVNGDLLAKLDYRKLWDYHRGHRADLTMAVYPYTFQVPYGVIESNDECVQNLIEKPEHMYLINAGIYVMESEVRNLIPRGEPTSMSHLINMLIKRGQCVVQFPHLDYWLDIGQPADYERAQLITREWDDA